MLNAIDIYRRFHVYYLDSFLVSFSSDIEFYGWTYVWLIPIKISQIEILIRVM